MSNDKLTCASCLTEFRVRTGEPMDNQCPNCQHVIECAPGAQRNRLLPSAFTATNEDAAAVEKEAVNGSQEAGSQEAAVGEADHLLPPTFGVPDPDDELEAAHRDDDLVILPTATGGTQAVNQRTVRIVHNGKLVELKTRTPAEKKRLRIVRNCIALVICLIILRIAFVLFVR